MNEVDKLYTLLKSKIIGRCVNGHLLGTLTEEDLEEAYKEVKDED